MAFAHVNSTQGSGTGSITVTIPTTSVNNLVVLTIRVLSPTATINSVIDNASTPNLYTKAIGPIVSSELSQRVSQYYGVQVAGGVTQITIAVSASPNVRVNVDEFSGNALTNSSVFDTAGSNIDGGTATTSASLSQALTPVNAGELIVAGLGPASGGNLGTVTQGTGYTIATGQTNLSSEYKLSGTTSETAPISWQNNNKWVLVAGAYLPFSTMTTTATYPRSIQAIQAIFTNTSSVVASNLKAKRLLLKSTADVYVDFDQPIATSQSYLISGSNANDTAIAVPGGNITNLYAQGSTISGILYITVVQ